MLPKGMVRWVVEGEMGVSSAVLSGIGLAVVLWGDVHVRPCMSCRFWWLPGVGSGRLLEGDASEGWAWGSGCGHGGHGWEGPWVAGVGEGIGRNFCGGPSQESCDLQRRWPLRPTRTRKSRSGMHGIRSPVWKTWPTGSKAGMPPNSGRSPPNIPEGA